MARFVLLALAIALFAFGCTSVDHCSRQIGCVDHDRAGHELVSIKLEEGAEFLGEICITTAITLFEEDGFFRGADDVAAVFNVKAAFPLIRTAQKNVEVRAPAKGSESLNGVIKSGIRHEGAEVDYIVKFNEVGGVVVMTVTWFIHTAEIRLHQNAWAATACYIISKDSIIVSDLDERVDMTCGIKESWGSAADLYMEKNTYTSNLKAICNLINGKSINVKVVKQSEVQEGDIDKEIADILAEMDEKGKD